MFKIFSFKFGNVANLKNVGKVKKVISSFLDNIYIGEFAENYTDTFWDTNKTEKSTDSFIKLEKYEDMYLLSIDLKGIDLRELSIRYDTGVIEINLNRTELEKAGLTGLFNNKVVKKGYNKRFKNLEEIDISQVIKSVDDGILTIRMPKKYILEKIIDVDSYEDNVYK